MKKYKQRIFETICKRCGRKIYVSESALSHPLGRICERCITPNEKQQIMDFQVARMMKHDKRYGKNPNILGFQIGKPKGLYESFHGNPSQRKRKLKIQVPEKGEKLIAIGRLINLEYSPYGSSQYKKTHFTHKLGDNGNKILPNKPILAVSEDGKQLFIVNDKSFYKFGKQGIVG